MPPPTLDRVLDAVIRVDTGFAIHFISESGEQWLRKAGFAATPANFIELLHVADRETLRQAAHGSPEYFWCDLRISREGNEKWINVRSYLLPDAHQFMLCIIDISTWKGAGGDFKHAAEHDELTGLANRVLLKRSVEALIEAKAKPFCVALLDLDGFKKVNDTYGHLVGDAVLVETAQRLTTLMGPDDMACRLGGDEFVILLGGQSADQAASLMADVLFAIARPYDTSPHRAYLGVSIGIAEFPLHGEDYSTLLKRADTAMYHSKNAGKNQVSVFFQSDTAADFSIRAAIHTGIRSGEFFLEFQPQYDLDRRLVGAEALMRWTSRDLGRVAPDKFIPVVEDSGLMPYLGQWALRYACHQLKAFQRNHPDFLMSVNVSPIQFSAEDFDTIVLQAIAETGIDPSRLILEITESTLMQSHERTESALRRLREHGVRFSIDDFGTGFSSLAYLTRLPVSSIKIDKAFVRAMDDASRDIDADRKLIIAMINLARGIDLKVVAEGVETEEQFSFLKDSGCDLIQGYLLGKPLPAATMVGLLSAPAGDS